MAQIEVKVPDIGDFKDVPVITVFVKPGDTVAKEDPLLELESDKATMEVPAPAAGKVVAVKVKAGDKVAEGTVILTLEAEGAAAAPAAKPAEAAPAPRPSAAPTGDIHAELVVLGSGPGGYTAAFRAADLGLKVVLIERNPTLGGVCLNVGCIPSKALLHAAKVISEAEEMGHFGVKYAKPEIDIDGLRGWKESVVKKLTGGLTGLAKARKVTVVSGVGTFTGPNAIRVEGADGAKTVSFDQCVIAAGSEPVKLPFIPDDPRVIELDRRAGARRGAEAAAGDRRRHHRAGDGHGLRRARDQGDDRRVHGADHPRGRRRRGEAALQAHREAVRGDPSQVEGHRRDGARHRARGGDGGAERRRSPTSSTGCWSRSGGGRTARRSAPRPRA